MRYRRWPPASVVVLGCITCLVLLRAATITPRAQRFPEAGVDYPVQRVVDGDTLLLETGHRVRLLGVDTPETKHPDRPVERLGREASQFTRRFVGDDPVRLEFDRERRDPYRRILAYVYVRGEMLNEELIRAGYSRAEVRFPFRRDRKKLFLAAEEQARAAHLKMWRTE